MATIQVDGVWWFDRAWESARRKGVEAALASIVRDWRSGDEGVAVYPDPSGQGRSRVQRDGLAAVIGEAGVVIGFVTRATRQEAYEARPETPRATKAPRRGPTGPSGSTNPTSFRELEAMLAAGGFRVVPGPTHKKVVAPGGGTVSTLPSSASDHRALLNAVSILRRVTGLSLRRGES